MSRLGVRGHWSDGETLALIEAWGPRYHHGYGGSLFDAEWHQVCNAVNAHRTTAGLRGKRSVVQCQKRVYTLKDQYNKEIAKGRPTPGRRHFAQLQPFLAGPDEGPPPGFTAKVLPASGVKEEEVEVNEEVEETSVGASGSVGRRTVPAKRHFSSLQDIPDHSGGPPPGFPLRIPTTAKKEKEEVGREPEGPAHGAVSGGCCPGDVVTKLAEVYRSVEMKRLSVERGRMAMEREQRAAKVEAEKLGEIDQV